jgi:hypothetical protein
MKKLFLIGLIPMLFGCNEDNTVARTEAKDPLTKVIALKGGGFVTFKVVEIDGVTYFASRTSNGNYVIGPRKD